jgi:acyl-coenzyme A synthetase/AMP-(fatty) acid ligase
VALQLPNIPQFLIAYPRVIEFCTALPRNALGKVLKDKLVPR